MGTQSRRMLGLGSWNVKSLFCGKRNHKCNHGHRPYLEGLESRVMLSADPLQAMAVYALSDTALPQVSISATNTTIEEGKGASEVTTVTISRDITTKAQTVYFKVTGTAKRGTDYVIRNGDGLVITGSSVALKAGVSSATLTIETKDDLIGEGAEYATITLSANSAYTIAPGSSSITSTITDNEPMVAIDGVTGTATGFGSDAKVVRSLTGDINNDGKVDIINILQPASGGDDNIEVLLNNKSGYGSFNVSSSFRVAGDDLRDLKLVDVNGDKKLDLVAMSTSSYSGHNMMSVSVLINDGKGSFTLSNVYGPTLGTDFTSVIDSVIVADFTGDGRVDIVVAGTTVDTIGDRQVLNLYGFRGLAGGGFTTATTFEINASTSAADVVTGMELVAKDMNGDKRLDLVALSKSGTGLPTVSVLVNSATVGFVTAKYTLPDASYRSLLVEDVTGDGKADLVMHSVNGGNTDAKIYTYVNDGTGVLNTFTLVEDIALAPLTDSTSLTLADLNGDKKLDLIFVDSLSVGGGLLSVALNKGNGSFEDVPTPYSLAAPVDDGNLADLNGDGKLDIVVVQTNDSGPTPTVYTEVLMNQGNGTFNMMLYQDDAVDSGTSTLSLVDVNGDKKIDILQSGNDSGGAGHVLLNNGDGTFAFQFATKEVATGDSAAPITFALSRSGGDTTNALTVNFGVTGTAKRGIDYKLAYEDGGAIITGNTVTIAAGDAAVKVVLVPLTDALAENSETVQLLIKTGTGYQLNPAAKGVAAVIQDFAPVLSITAYDGEATETVGNDPDTGTFIITAENNNGTEPLTVNFVVSGSAVRGKDYVLKIGDTTLTTNTVTFDVGESEVAITVVPITDDVIEATKYVNIALANNTAKWTINPSAAAAKVAIDNLQESVITVAATTTTALESNAVKPAVFTFTRTGGNLNQTLDVDYTISGSATNGADYETLSGTVSFAAGSKTATVLVTPKDDTTTEGAETLKVTLAPSSTDSYKVTGTVASQSATVTIKENAYAPASVDDASVNVTSYVETDVVTKVSHSGGVQFYMANETFFMVSANEIVNGTWKYVQKGSTTGTLTLRENNSHTRVTHLTFTTTKDATFTGEVIDGSETIIKTIRGTLRISIPTTSYAPISLNGLTVSATTTRSSDRSDVGSVGTMVFGSATVTKTNKNGSKVVAYTYSAESPSYGLLKFTDEGSEILIQFTSPTAANYWCVNNSESFWEMGTIKVTAIKPPN